MFVIVKPEVVDNEKQFSCIVNGAVIGSSKHPDYFEHHYKRGDVKRLKGLDIQRFVHVDEAGEVQMVNNVLKADDKISIIKADTPKVSVMIRRSIDALLKSAEAGANKAAATTA